MNNILKCDKDLYNGIGNRLNLMLNDTLGKVAPTQKRPIYSKGNLISFSYIFENNKDVYLYIKDIDGIITIELKNWKQQRIETKFNVDMNEIKDVIIKMYEKITEEINTENILDTFFSSRGNASSNCGFGKGFDDGDTIF